MKYGWKYYLEPTPKNVSKWLLALRAVIGLVQAGAAYEHLDWKIQIGLLGIGALMHELGSMFAADDKKEEEKVG